MDYFDIRAVSEANTDFRRVIWTGEHTQLVLMTIPPSGEIGGEVHPDNDQILQFVAGRGRADVAGDSREVGPGDLVVVPSGTEHNFVNTGNGPLVLTTVYGPPDHAPGTVHRTKEEADADEHDVPPQEQ
ncbi:MAG: cupin domain-containing protein [Actinomycetota bacterium]|nr:cupin domain-containing protein [Actinomycetota bacterium]